MNKKAYIICYNHMDPVWRRCFEDHFEFEGNVIRSYAEIEEAQFDQWMDIVQNSECIYSIEQSLTVKKYLERNPDQFEKFKQLVQNGKIELLGGGETIIEYNMVHGESIVRSHLYSILWYKENFGRVPEQAMATDTFGLSAQLPQIFRNLGYSAILRYDRVFDQPRPYWKGLNGDLIYIKQQYGGDQGIKEIIMTDWIKYLVCDGCKGSGCKVCDHTGLDYSYKSNSMHFSMEELFIQMKDAEEQTFLVQFLSEEVLKTDNFTGHIEMLKDKYQIEVEYIAIHDVLDKFAKPYMDKLKSGFIDEAEIDARTEGNTASTGCYVSRIELKKKNRELENMLLSCEKFAAFAAGYGMLYPRKKLERLWNKMSFLQFHDCITATHIDAGYDELIKVCRDIALGAGQIMKQAGQIIERQIDIPDKDGFQSFVLYNPLNWTVKDTILEAVLEVGGDQPIEGLTIEDSEGRRLEILHVECVEAHRSRWLTVKFKGATLPPVGYQVFFYKSEGNIKQLSSNSGKVIENEYYRIQANGHKVISIYDKELKENILVDGAGGLIVEDDWGSPWDTQSPPYFSESIAKPDFLEYVTKRNYRVEMNITENEECQVLTFSGSYLNRERKVEKLIWSQEITLYKGIKKVFFKTDIDWDSSNLRLKVAFPLGFKTEEDEAYYEIPYGTLKRKPYEPVYAQLSTKNGDWPALNFVSCRNEEKDYTVTLINKGLPCHRLSNGTLHLSILRSPTNPVTCLFDFDGARDTGFHTFEYMITSNSGGLKEGRVVQLGTEFNTSFANCQGNSKTGTLGLTHSFLRNTNENIIIPCVKLAENSGQMVIRAYEAYGEVVEDTLLGLEDKEIRETNLLEETSDPVQAIRFGGFEIKTFTLE